MLVSGYFGILWLTGPHRHSSWFHIILFCLACLTVLVAILSSIWAVLDNRE